MQRSASGSSHYKRKRSRSRSWERYRDKVKKSSPAPASSKHADFSFTHYKRKLNKIILYSSDTNTVVNSLEDFWAFVKKYESTLVKAGKPIVELDSQNNDENVQRFSKFDCVNFTTVLKYVDIVSDDRERRKLDKRLFEAFLNIVSIYIDFKNREKFEKLKKLRQAQKDLPVANYRYVSFIILLKVH